MIFAATILQARAVVSEQRALSDYSCTSRMRLQPSIDVHTVDASTSHAHSRSRRCRFVHCTRTDGDLQCVFSSEKTIQGIDHRHVNLTPVIKNRQRAPSAGACCTVLLTKCVWGSLDHPCNNFKICRRARLPSNACSASKYSVNHQLQHTPPTAKIEALNLLINTARASPAHQERRCWCLLLQ